ncbi:DUF2288 domain-containing protein [Facilibium subflavum]|uniref:DUF2288 domain-containing protein n=1 Tax=Facilibium subflavum TaxID=2219058 RepID=UPI000E652539|nr:DUF2288 domain-containing protein [Facilibium subflavum]
MNKSELTTKINYETAKVHWHELQRFFAAGKVLFVDKKLDLVEAATHIAHDNMPKVTQWLNDNLILPVSDTQAKKWYKNNTVLWANIVKPWILVQKL